MEAEESHTRDSEEADLRESRHGDSDDLIQEDTHDTPEATSHDTPEATSHDTPEAMEAAEAADPARSAMERLQSRTEEEGAAERGLSWTWLAGLVILLLSIVGVWMWTHRDEPQETSLLRHAAEAAVEFRLMEVTNDPDRAASYVLEEFGLSLFPPELDGFVLLGVGSAELVPGVVVPAYRYDGNQGVTTVVFVYDYILLDQAAQEGLLTLAPEVYARLSEPEPVDSRRVGDAYVVTWRRRSMIFSAVAPGQDVAERILQNVRRPEI